jgi:oxygen-independent coproporphyrinogen-3 oxidase
LYCDFFSTTLLERREAYVATLLKEIEQRKHEANAPICTIYLGGGTPSTLPANDIARILTTIGTKDAQEITMELNPGDATPEYLHAIRAAGINRLSIGIQSFKDNFLSLIGRRHTVNEAIQAVRMAQEAGFDNISIDLIYALPTQTMNDWIEDIETALSLQIQHISSYGLMYEEGTEMTRRLHAGELEAVDEEIENAMYDTLCERLQQAGFVHYEVSNFALPGYEARHNSSYWNHTPYIGVGAGAHSFLPPVRSWNPSDLDTYIRGIEDGTLVRENEWLTDQDLYNERIMLGLRTRQGVAEEAIKSDVQSFIDQGLLHSRNARIIATQNGIHVLNRIIEQLMI